MAHGRFGHGKQWAYLGGLAIACAAGCQSTERDEGFGGLDARTKAMLLAPAGGSLKAPPQQYAVTDPAVTGATGLKAQNSFNRAYMGAQPSYSAPGDQSAPAYAVSQPSTTGIVQAGVNAPTMPTTGGSMQLQPKIQQAHATAPSYTPSEPTPPVMPSAPAAAAPPVIVVGSVPAATPLAQTITPAQPAPEFVPPAIPTSIAVTPPAMPPTTIAPTPQPVAVQVETPKAPGGLTTLASPVEQPPPGLGPIAPATIK